AFVRPFRALTAGRRFPDVRSRSQPIGRPGREPHDVARPGRREEGIVRVLPPAAVLLLALLGACAQARGPAPPTTTTASLPPWTWELPACPAYRAADYAAPEHRVSVQVAADGTVTEVYQDGWAARALAETRAVVTVCGEYEPAVADAAEEYREQHQVVATGFADADESLLIRTVKLAPHQPIRTWYTMVVREGDRVTTQEQQCPPAVEATCAAPQA